MNANYLQLLLALACLLLPTVIGPHACPVSIIVTGMHVYMQLKLCVNIYAGFWDTITPNYYYESI